MVEAAVAQEWVVCIVDDDEAVRESLEVLLETMGYTVESYASGEAFLENCASLGPGCVLLDVRMPRMNGLEVQQQLQEIRHDMPVIIVTGHGDVTMAVRAMQAGAVDFIEKPFDEDALLSSVRTAISHVKEVHKSETFRTTVLRNLARLTPREREVFDQLIIGHANKVVARRLDCSPRTVEIHRARVLEKMDATSVAQLVRMALSAGVEIADE